MASRCLPPVALVVATLSLAPFTSTLSASGNTPTVTAPASSVSQASVTRSRFAVQDQTLLAAAAESRQWGRRRGRYRRHHDSARTAVVLGAIGAIAGTAVLVYANRPECGDAPSAAGCGYGTKVLGGAMLAAGGVGLAVGAASW